LLFCLQAFACLTLANPGPFTLQQDPAEISSTANDSTAQDPSTAQDRVQPVSSDDAEKAINGLVTVTQDLSKAVRSYQRHLDEAESKYDRGRLAADADLIGGDAGVVQAAVRHALAARGMAVAQEDRTYRPTFLTDLNEIQNLILATRRRIGDSEAVSRGLLVVSSEELRSGEAKRKSLLHAQLKKARDAAGAAATEALVDLPIPLPEDNSAKDESFFEAIFRGGDNPWHPEHPESNSSQHQNSRETPAVSLPLHWEQGKRTTLINERGYRLALTAPGVQDAEGRWLFYQEEWIQRGAVVQLKAQLLGVDPSSGQHLLLKRYPMREFTGSVQDVYSVAGLNETRSVKPPLSEPSRQQAESALGQVGTAPERLLAARQHYMDVLRTSLARSDQRHLDRGESSLDEGLPEETRVLLYALRGHVLRVTHVLDAEKELREQTQEAEQRIEELKRLAAWANRASPEVSRAAVPVSEWDSLQNKADDAIYAARTAIASALAALPPDGADHYAKFPELLKDGIVHLLSVRASTEPGRAVWQEVWDWDGPSTHRRARQRIDTIVVDPKTGNQIRLSHQMKYYPVDHDESLVDAYERLAGPVAPPVEVSVPPGLY
jgi:hypothetical protein